MERDRGKERDKEKEMKEEREIAIVANIIC